MRVDTIKMSSGILISVTGTRLDSSSAACWTFSLASCGPRQCDYAAIRGKKNAKPAMNYLGMIYFLSDPPAKISEVYSVLMKEDESTDGPYCITPLIATGRS
jgi:hypothetical protein